MKGRSIIPTVKRRRNVLNHFFMSGLIPAPMPEAVRRQMEINNRIQAEAMALWEIEQKHPKRLEDKRESATDSAGH